MNKNKKTKNNKKFFWNKNWMCSLDVIQQWFDAYSYKDVHVFLKTILIGNNYFLKYFYY